MEEKKNWAKLSKEELNELLKNKQEDYEETEEMKEFLLNYTTNHHVPGYTHKEYMEKLNRLEKEIQYIKDLIEEQKNAG